MSARLLGKWGPGIVLSGAEGPERAQTASLLRCYPPDYCHSGRFADALSRPRRAVLILLNGLDASVMAHAGEDLAAAFCRPRTLKLQGDVRVIITAQQE